MGLEIVAIWWYQRLKVKAKSAFYILSLAPDEEIFYFRNEETGRRTHAEHFLVRKKSCGVKRVRMVRETTSDGRLLDVCMPPRDADSNYLLYMVDPLAMCILENYTMLESVCIEDECAGKLTAQYAPLSAPILASNLQATAFDKL